MNNNRRGSNKTSFPIVAALVVFYMVLLTSCGEKPVNISLLPESDFYLQSASINNKLDILFVVDNSGSMAEEQVNLANNFNAFINQFVTKSYDFQIAVASTDAWGTRFGYNCFRGTSSPACARLRDGDGSAPNHSGVFIITPNTPSISSVFGLNVRTGTTGTGDERAFDSIRQALDWNNSPNNTFLRRDSFLAVVIVSDEDDFSHNGTNMITDRNNPNLHSISSYVSYLDSKTASTPDFRRYNVSSIGVFDTACETANAPSGGRMGVRYQDLVIATDGIQGSICDSSFANSLNQIQTKIAELSTQFKLSRRPDPSTIVVRVNGVVIPNNPTNGWSYNSTANSIVFHGSAIPSQGAQIQIDFDPVEVL